MHYVAPTEEPIAYYAILAGLPDEPRFRKYVWIRAAWGGIDYAAHTFACGSPSPGMYLFVRHDQPAVARMVTIPPRRGETLPEVERWQAGTVRAVTALA